MLSVSKIAPEFSFGRSMPVREPKLKILSYLIISSTPIFSPISIIATLQECLIASASVCVPWLPVHPMVRSPTCREPVQVKVSSGLIAPDSRAAATVMGLIVEPGSKAWDTA